MSWADHLIDAIFSWPIFLLAFLYGVGRWIARLVASPSINVKTKGQGTDANFRIG